MFRKTQYYLYLERRFARICNLTPAQRVTYIGKVMNLEVGKAGAAVSQTQNFITRPYLYGLFRREREREREKSLVWRGGQGRTQQGEPCQREKGTPPFLPDLFSSYMDHKIGRKEYVVSFCGSPSLSTKDAYVKKQKRNKTRKVHRLYLNPCM